jgi:predicted nucleotidyltransferase component of viral defense system
VIARADIDARVGEWGLREDIVEKDYVLGWVLWGIGSDPVLGKGWIFKGGTCLKKCYIETYRFSEDLDFTVVEGSPLEPADVLPALDRVLARVGEESGIDFAVRTPALRALPTGWTVQGRIYYRGPRNAPTAASVKLDLSGDELVVRPPVLRPISHPYPDAFPSEGVVRCYGFEEVFAEKLRAMGERGRPRDLYDIVNLFRRPDLRRHPEVIREVLTEKCHGKGVAVPTIDAVTNSPFRAELESEWSNMLGHQLPSLPPLEQFLDELPHLFAWLEEGIMPEVLEPIAVAAGERVDWLPPPTAATWGAGVPLETVRFAAVNHLCVELGYQGSRRLIEPYSLRRTRDGNLILHAVRVDNRGHRGYRVDQIQSVRVTNTPFVPVHAIEFTSQGALSARPAAAGRWSIVRRRTRSGRRSSGGGIVYVIECTVCQKRFRRKTNNPRLRPHKTPDGWDCLGRQGYVADIQYS